MKLKCREISLAILFLIVSSSIFIGIWVWLDGDKPKYYEILPLLPLTFGLISLIFVKVYTYIDKNMSVFIIITLYYIRNVLSIFLLSIGNYNAVLPIQSYKSVFNSVLLMNVETLFVFFTILLCIKNYDSKDKKLSISSNKIMDIIKRKKVNIFGIIIITCIIILLTSYIIIPEVRTLHVSIFESSDSINSVGSNSINFGGIKRIFYTLFSVLFNFCRIYIPIILMYFIKNKMGYSLKSMALNYLIIFIQLLFIPGETIYVLIVMAVLTIFLLKLYPIQAKKIGTLMLVCLFIGTIFMFSVKIDVGFKSNTKLESISSVTQAYFPGITNISGVFNIQNPNKISTLFFDFYYMIPFRETLFGIDGERLVIVYNLCNFVVAQIIPCIGQAYHYFGIFAPIIPMLITKLAIKYDYKRKNEQNIFKYSTYTLIVLYAAATPVMYNVTIFGNRYFSLILPMMLLSNYSSNKFNFKNIKN